MITSSLFAGVRQAIADEIGAIQQNAQVLKTVDALLSLATVARENDYVKPVMNEEGRLCSISGTLLAMTEPELENGTLHFVG